MAKKKRSKKKDASNPQPQQQTAEDSAMESSRGDQAYLFGPGSGPRPTEPPVRRKPSGSTSGQHAIEKADETDEQESEDA